MKKNSDIHLHVDSDTKIRLIPIDRITVLNPRSRNQKIFAQLVENISKIGLKRPITVTEKGSDDQGILYQLVCGQGRLEAFQTLEQDKIPCVIVNAEEEDCYLISLVENLARRKHSNKKLLSAIQDLDDRGYSTQEISQKIGFHKSYINGILYLLKNGEERLIAAVERGWLPIDLASDISKADDSKMQLAMLEAYQEGALSSHQLMKIRRLISQRKMGGKSYDYGGNRSKSPVTPEKLMSMYSAAMYSQKVMIKKADINEQWLSAIISSLKVLLKDDNFNTLLRAERIQDIPEKLANRIYKNEG
ncbi:chromosome partitioning protein ParB [Gammaproteobacteria bacterium ESL0073]|nr:chromosome partitioning protein ParB [Gammaproteobacteria bacterium ESL0073]